MSMENAEKVQNQPPVGSGSNRSLIEAALSSLENTGDVTSLQDLEKSMGSGEEGGSEAGGGGLSEEQMLAVLSGKEDQSKEPAEAEGEESKEVKPEEPEVQPEENESEPEVSNIEVIEYEGRELEIDWDNRDVLRKVVQKSMQAKEDRRAKELMQIELDEFKLAQEESNGETERVSGILREIESAKELGPEAVVQLLFGRSLDDFQKEWAERAGWSEDKKEAYAESMKTRRLEAEIAAMKKQAEDSRIAAEQAKVEAQAQNVRNHFESSYRKHMIDGVFGDPELDENIDNQLFNNVKAKFDKLEMSDITPADIEEAFKSERARLVKLYGNAVRKSTVDTIEKKKTEALKAAQTRASSQQPRKSEQEQFESILKSGDVFKHFMNDPSLINKL